MTCTLLISLAIPLAVSHPPHKQGWTRSISQAIPLARYQHQVRKPASAPLISRAIPLAHPPLLPHSLAQAREAVSADADEKSMTTTISFF